jgi:hypothetical protein
MEKQWVYIIYCIQCFSHVKDENLFYHSHHNIIHLVTIHTNFTFRLKGEFIYLIPYAQTGINLNEQPTFDTYLILENTATKSPLNALSIIRFGYFISVHMHASICKDYTNCFNMAIRNKI